MLWIVMKILAPLGIAALLGMLLGFALRGIGLKRKMQRAVAERDLAVTDRNQLRKEVDDLYSSKAAHTEANRNGTSGGQDLHAELERRDTKLKALNEELANSKKELERLRSTPKPEPKGDTAKTAGAAAAGAAGGAVLTAITGGGKGRDLDAAMADLQKQRDESQWRNRYLESRVRMLEETINKLQPGTVIEPTPHPDEVDGGDTGSVQTTQSGEKESLVAELEKLRVENAELRAKAEAVPPKMDTSKLDESGAGKSPRLAEIEQELARLRWRNRYLESRLDYLEGNPETAEAEAELAAKEGEASAPTLSVVPTSPEPEASVETTDSTETVRAEESPAPEPEPEVSPEPFQGAAEVQTETEAEAPVEEAAPSVEPEPEPQSAVTPDVGPVAAEPAAAPDVGEPIVIASEPERLKRPRDGFPDDLTAIQGIGPLIAQALNNLGIFHFDQVASWTEGEGLWVDEKLGYKGRVLREDWIGKAKALAGPSAAPEADLS